jgi:hypothetical protein
MSQDILTTVVSVFEGGSLTLADTVRYADGLWIALSWSEPQTSGLIYPSRLVRIDRLPYQTLAPNNQWGANFVLNAPLPKALLDPNAPLPTASTYEVLDRPNVGFRPRTGH